MARYEYETVDVFTAERFGGNPLAVVPDARGLSDAQMQALAAEFNYSESTFVLPPDDPANDARVRIFTRTREVPFAGHPNVGTAYVLARRGALFGRAPGPHLRFEEAAGLVAVDLRETDGAVTGARIRAPQPLATGRTMPAGIFAACLSLPPSAVIERHHPPRIASVGLAFYMGELDDAALAAARPDTAAMSQALEEYGRDAPMNGRISLFAYAREGDGIDRLRARMFSPLSGTHEDPATGSACSALGALLLSLDPRPEAEEVLAIRQGIEMGRPSALEVAVRKRGGAVDEVSVAGPCVAVMRGHVEV